MNVALEKKGRLLNRKTISVGKKYKNIHQELINQCKQGNAKAQFEIYKLYYKAMFNTSLRLVNDSQEAEDIMQEAFLSAFKKIDSYKEEVSFGAWLKKIVVNRSLDVLKKRKVQLEDISEQQIPIADVMEQNKEQEINSTINKVKQVITELPEKDRLLISLHLIEGYTHEEISEILDMSNAAVRTGYSRARKKLQEMLNKKKISIWMN